MLCPRRARLFHLILNGSRKKLSQSVSRHRAVFGGGKFGWGRAEGGGGGGSNSEFWAGTSTLAKGVVPEVALGSTPVGALYIALLCA